MLYDKFRELMFAGQEQPIESEDRNRYSQSFEQLYNALNNRHLLTEDDVKNLALTFRTGANLGTYLTALLIGKTSGVKMMAACAQKSRI